MPDKINILSTRLIDETLVDTAAMYQIGIDHLTFITTEEINTPALEKRIAELSQQNINAIFTSMNAVNAVTRLISNKPLWKIFCIGHQTKNLIATFFGQENIIGTADNAAQLADRIIEDISTKKIVFFSGCQRRDELPEKIKSHGIELEELNVYQTMETPHVISKKYDGVLFFSPSAVKSFFSVNKIDEKTQIFAIGSTTAEEARSFTHSPIILAEHPDVDNLVCQVIRHFKKIKTS